MTRSFEAQCRTQDGSTLVFDMELPNTYVYIGEQDSNRVKADFLLSVSDAVKLAETILEEYGND